MRSKIVKRMLAFTMAMAACVATAVVPCTVKAADEEFDPNGTYHAAMGIQTCNVAWINRQAYFTESLNQTYETDMDDKLWAADPSADGSVYDGVFENVEIAGNGTYQVSLTGANFDGETDISQLYIATDIPVTEAIKVTDFTVIINDKKIVTFPEATLEGEEKYLEGGMIILAVNHWRKTLVQALSDLGVEEEAGGSGIRVLQGTGNESIKLIFTISGFDYDNPDAVIEEETEAPTEAPAQPTTQAPTKAPATTTKAADKDDSKGMPMGAIIGIICGAVVIIGVICVVAKKKK